MIAQQGRPRTRLGISTISPVRSASKGVYYTPACAAGPETASRPSRHPPWKHFDLIHPGLALARIGHEQVAKLSGLAERRPIEDHIVASPFGTGLHPILKDIFKNFVVGRFRDRVAGRGDSPQPRSAFPLFTFWD